MWRGFSHWEVLALVGSFWSSVSLDSLSWRYRGSGWKQSAGRREKLHSGILLRPSRLSIRSRHFVLHWSKHSMVLVIGWISPHNHIWRRSMIVRVTCCQQQCQQMAIVFITLSCFWWTILQLEWLNYEVCCFSNQLRRISGWSTLVRVIMELVRDARFYENLHMQYLGPVHLALQSISKNGCYSESYEMYALCNILQCNIRSFCPSIGMNPAILAMVNKVFTPMSSRNANFTIAILWSHAEMEMDAKAANHGHWSPNHFVPLLSGGGSGASNDGPALPSIPVQFLPKLTRWWTKVF